MTALPTFGLEFESPVCSIECLWVCASRGNDYSDKMSSFGTPDCCAMNVSRFTSSVQHCCAQLCTEHTFRNGQGFINFTLVIY